MCRSSSRIFRMDNKRGGGFLLWLFAASGISSAAHAQSTPKIIDENGIDQVTGSLALVEKDLHIGPEDGGLSLNRVVGNIDRIDHNWNLIITGDGGGVITHPLFCPISWRRRQGWY
jgi:hypothetical protein